MEGTSIILTVMLHVAAFCFGYFVAGPWIERQLDDKSDKEE